MAHLQKKIISYTGGIESRVEGLGTFFLVLGIIAAAFWVYVAISAARYEVISLGILQLSAGLTLWVLFTGIADWIRQAKRLKGLPYGGQILEPNAVTAQVCSECGSSNFVQTKTEKIDNEPHKMYECQNCKARIVGEAHRRFL